MPLCEKVAIPQAQTESQGSERQRPNSGRAGASMIRPLSGCGATAWLFVLVLPFLLSCALLAKGSEQAAKASELIAETLSLIQTRGLTVNVQSLEQTALRSVVHSADPHGDLYAGEERHQFQEQQTGSIYDPGYAFTMSNGFPVVAKILSGSPAETASLREGETVVSVDQESIEPGELCWFLKRLRKPAPTTIRLGIRDSLNRTNHMDVVTKKINVPSIHLAEELPSGIGYLKLNGIYKHAGQDVVSVLRGWDESEQFGTILDLRGTKGADLDSVVAIASLYASPGTPLFSYHNRTEQELIAYETISGPMLNKPTMVLIDQDTSGAPEVLAAVLKGSVKGTLLIGKPTRGDPLVREVIELTGHDLAIYIATKTLKTQDGLLYAGQRGVAPHITVGDEKTSEAYEPAFPDTDLSLLEEEIEDKKLRERVRGDIVLRRATDLLLGLKALDRVNR